MSDTSKIKPTFGFVVQYVRDMEVAKKFYVEVMGLQVQREHPTYVQFDSFALATDAPTGTDAAQELYWLVDDAEAAWEEVSPKAEITSPLEEKPFGKVFGVKDPDGQTRYLLEFAKNRPSQATQ